MSQRTTRRIIRAALCESARCSVAYAMIAGLCLAPVVPLRAQTQPSAAQAPAPSTAQAQIPGTTNQGATQVRIPPPPVPPTSASILQSTSEVVRIDIQVTDKSGKTIKGLKPAQFTITDDGKAQKISTFSYEDIEAIQTAANSEDSQPVVVAVDTPRGTNPDTVSTATRDRRMLVLYFDLSSMQPDDLLRAHDAAVKFINTQMQKADLVSVVAYSTQLSTWSDFTNNHATLLKAISRLTARREFRACRLHGRRAKRRIRRHTRYASRVHGRTKPNSTRSTRTRNSKPSKASPTCSPRFPDANP